MVETIDIETGEVADVDIESQAKPFGMVVPARILHVAAIAAKEQSRYAIDAVLIETVGAENVAVCTDGRRIIVATWKRALYDTLSHVLMPASVAKAALKLACVAKPDEDEPSALIEKTDEKNFILSLQTNDGPVQFQFQPYASCVFPAYRSILCDWSESTGIRAIGISGKLVGDTLKTINAIVNDGEYGVTMRLPSAPDKAIGLQTRDDTITIESLVMPRDCGISDWSVNRESTEEDGESA